MKTLGVYTKNFSLYHDILKALKRRNIHYVLLSSVRHVPNQVGLILSSQKEIEQDSMRGKGFAVDVFESVDFALDHALQKLSGRELYAEVLIGIDPGERPGVAVVGDEVVLQKQQVASPEHVFDVVFRYLKMYPGRETVIRIGHGSIITRNRIINSLIPLKIPIEIVDETRTTVSHHLSRSKRDEVAAVSIALLSGGRVRGALPLHPSKGAIRNVQRKSRQLTRGKSTISEEKAVEVLKGKLSLQEAVDAEKKSKPKCL